MNARRLVVEYDSIQKLESKYDMVYMDEIRSVLATAICDATNRMNATRHLNRLLMELCAKAKHTTILTDADSDLDCAVDVFRDRVFEAKDVKTIHVSNPSMGRQFTLMRKDSTYEQCPPICATDIASSHALRLPRC